MAAVVGALAFVTSVAGIVAAVALRDLSRVRVPELDLEQMPMVREVVDRRRGRQADHALPDVLETVARGLRSGSTLAAALAAASPSGPQQLAAEWSKLVASAGDAGVGAAADRWRSSRPSSAVALTAAALAVAAEVGGPQARAIDGVAVTLRERLALTSELAALTAQARASAGVLAFAPVAFAVVAGGLEPRYLPFLFGTPLGLVFLVSGLALLGAGLAWMARLTRIAA